MRLLNLHMKYIILIVLILSINFSNSQNVLILESNSNLVIPFANVMTDSISVYSNENGVVDLSRIEDESVVIISSIGYQTLEIEKKEIKEILYLEPIDYILPSIVILANERVIEDTKRLRDSKKLGSQILPRHTNITTKIIPREKLVSKRITSIKLLFERHSGMSKNQKEIFKKSKLLIRLNFFNVDGDSLGELIHSSETFNLITGSTDELVVSLKEVQLKLSKDGFYIQLENLGAVDEKGEFIEGNNGLFIARAKISDKKSTEYFIESYKLTSNGQYDIENQLNYKDVFGDSDLDKNFFLNFQFSYYE